MIPGDLQLILNNFKTTGTVKETKSVHYGKFNLGLCSGLCEEEKSVCWKLAYQDCETVKEVNSSHSKLSYDNSGSPNRRSFSKQYLCFIVPDSTQPVDLLVGRPFLYLPHMEKYELDI
ncbi:hypothetical protein NPIL_92701 [Nephila pilipes]|uniref:Uncharacterized protein n=1 Tax=Nephila pilipes TaxID=299642 RepID=A0A8X6TYE9_NEPPI|nr:hypothetical protein NPIL_92701 [Nephila pilipes]